MTGCADAITPDCALMRPGQPCSRWQTPPLGVCSRQGGERTCGACFRERMARLVTEDRERMMAALNRACGGVWSPVVRETVQGATPGAENRFRPSRARLEPRHGVPEILDCGE